MITKFKIFENINENPKVGDYVILKPEQCNYLDNGQNDKLIDIIKTNIGQITKIHGSGEIFKIEFENVATPFNVRILKIKYWSNNKEELELKLQANKYNL